MSFRSLLLGENDVLYFGNNNGFGYLEPDSTNSYQPIYLRPESLDKGEDIGRVHTIASVDDKIVFLSKYRLYVLNTNNNKIQFHESETGFRSMLNNKGRFFIVDLAKGLLEMKGDQLILMPGMEGFADFDIGFVAPYSDTEMIGLSFSKGLFKFDYEKITPWNLAISNSLKQSKIYSVLDIDGRYTSIGTLGNGLFIIDRNGKLIQKLDKINGLPSNVIYYQFLDADGSLWIGTNSGFCHAFINSPFSIIGEADGLLGSALKVTLHKGDMYVGTHEGIFQKNGSALWQTPTNAKLFTQLEGYAASTWSFASVGSDLFCGTREGLLQITGGTYKKLIPQFISFVYKLDENSLIAIGETPNPIQHLFKKRNGKWTFEKVISGIKVYADFMLKEDNGRFWLSDSERGLFSYYYSTEYDSVVALKSYNEEDGLPGKLDLRVLPFRNKVAVASMNGLYHLDTLTGKFVHDTLFDEAINDQFLYRFREGPTGNIYISGGMGKGFLRLEDDGNYVFQSKPFIKFEDHDDEYVFHENDSSVYIVSTTGLIHYDPTISYNPVKFNTTIRSVHTSTSGDSLIYGGDGQIGYISLPFEENALRIRYSSTFIDEPSKNEYRAKLAGYEDTFSDWTNDTEREYTNLAHGDYKLIIESKNIYEDKGIPASFSFSILPPWYHTVSAYVLYGAGIVLFIWGLLRLNSRRLIREKEQLEDIIADRTNEIRKQKDDIERQAKKLKELDAVKSRFFANISHELRTPLTLIQGPLTALFNGEYGKVNKEVDKNMEVVKRNSDRLLTLVEEILDLAKLESGNLKLVENPVKLHELVTELTMAYRVEAQSRGIEYNLNFECERGLSLLLDEQKFSKIVNNLLSNAFKFTDDGGRIDVDVLEENSWLYIKVKDDGSGIHPDDVEYVFDRFYQSEQTDAKIMGGTGIGLALSKELAHLFNGKLEVYSQLGSGSEFVLAIQPKKTEDINSDDIIIPELSDIHDSLSNTLHRYADVYSIDKPVALLTEDYQDMREFVHKVVVPHFKVIEATNGQEALAQLKDHHVDLLISDVMMPKMDGFELLKAIKSDHDLRDLSIVMLTARSAEHDKLFALTLGVDDYLIKPFSSEELLVRARNIFENRISRKLSANEASNGRNVGSNVDIDFISRLKGIVMQNLSDSLLSVSYLASEVSMSERQLLRKLKSLTGYSVIQFIKEIKLQEAKRLLEHRLVETVSDASYKVGFDKVNYFSSMYIERFGIRPSDSLK